MVSPKAVLRTAIPAELRDWVDNRLVSAHIRIVRPLVLGSLLNAAVILIVLYGNVPTLQLGLFAGSTALAGFHRLWLSEGIERGRRRKRTAKMMRAFHLSSIWQGANIAIPLALWFPGITPGGQLLLAICGVTQIAAAAYMVRTLPWAAAANISLQALGLAIGLLRHGSPTAAAAVIVLLTASGLLIRMAFAAHDLFITRVLSDRELATSARTVKLLLNEYEASGSDWLFELDERHRLVKVSPRFAAAVGRAAADLHGLPFADLFAADAIRDTLITTLARRQPLRHAILRLADSSDDSPRWWSISGRPTYISPGEQIAFRGVVSDVTSRHQAETRARQMAHYDALTGLPNRALCDSTLAEMLDGRDPADGIALIHIDVDHFKAINDEFGHPGGDAYLRKVALRLTDIVAASGLGGTQRLVARLGGDEFAILTCGADACDHAVRLAQQVLANMARPITVEGQELPTSISIGIALAPFHTESRQQLFSYADIALSAAKRSERGIWEMFEPGMDAALHERHSLARDLRHAVARGELRLFLQPLVDVASEGVTGYEALLRWQHPERGLVMPDSFISIAEETGLIVGIGEWVIRTAFAEAATWPGAETISINLSPVQFGSAKLLPMIVNALAESGIAPGRVEFEITEGVLLNNSEANILLLNRLHDLGVTIALDDFGTGYASLNYLLTFPFDKIKIDRRFVNDLITRSESRAIVGAVIALANQLGMCTLAEGVEDRDQLIQLRSDGCRMVQGWLFGKAQPFEHYHPRVLGIVPPSPAVRMPRRRYDPRPMGVTGRQRS
ncbi:bifunctional diguanylate cyclase/phosphodiesterase [Novosphingobium sp.]|uniref:putative bifunctional diguanylate cyclase/phosphodiesterase n=1 Tax=Novosphingobium sp. TaxID=1874826 RepID=UPI0027366199|nr:EAL domain-containing protein [Novosphingobium sp.]MDP3907883.1 EAL domain-containing protein [Novosphingobium sp.]